VIFTLSFMVYLLLSHFGCVSGTLWPSMTSDGVEKLGDQTKKYMRGVLRARHLVGKLI